MHPLAPPGCTCDLQSPRCGACVERHVMWLGGTARLRGELWARRAAASVGTAHEWPPYEGRAADIARRHVRDLGSDERIAEALARECYAFAARTWAQIRGR